MTDQPGDTAERPGVIGIPPSRRIPTNPAQHAVQSAHEWQDVAESYVRPRMRELGIPEGKNGAPDFESDGEWRAFIAGNRAGGNLTTGITVNSGCLNPKLLTGKGSRLWPRASLRDRIDAMIAHKWEEDRTGSHEKALKAAPKTKLPISDGARRILKAMAR